MAIDNSNLKVLDDEVLESVSGGKFNDGTPAKELWAKIGVSPKSKKKKKTGPNGEILPDEVEDLKTALGMFGMN